MSSGVVAYVRNELGYTTNILFSYNPNNIEAIAFKFKSPYLSIFKYIIIKNVYISRTSPILMSLHFSTLW